MSEYWEDKLAFTHARDAVQWGDAELLAEAAESAWQRQSWREETAALVRYLLLDANLDTAELGAEVLLRLRTPAEILIACSALRGAGIIRRADDRRWELMR